LLAVVVISLANSVYDASMRSAAQVIRGLAALYKRLGYRVSAVVRDPCHDDKPYLFFVDDGEFVDRDGISAPTAVRLFPVSRDVRFEGMLASELERVLDRATASAR
jgi:hypothetical protein